MQDLLDLVSDHTQWKHVEPIVQETFTRMTQLFQKFNNKLAFIENTIYNKQKQPTQTDIDNKTVFKQHRVKWKSPLKETISHKTKHYTQQIPQIKNKKVKQIFPQELYLQSNETMFAMLVEQIQKLKATKKTQKSSKRGQITKGELAKGQSSEKYRRLEIRQVQLEQEMQTLISFVNDKIQSSIKHQHIRLFPQIPVSPPPMSTELTLKLFQIQKQLLSKPSFQSISQLIQNQYSQINTNIEQLQQYTETNLTSINKILNHQSSINLQVCRQMKVGKWVWEGRQKTKLTLVPWEKEVVNLFPESVIWNQNSTTLVIKQTGFYKIELYVIGDNSTLGIILNDDNSLFRKEETMTFSNKYTDVLEVTSNSNLSISSQNQNSTIIMILQKII